jgi:3-oxoacyl-[acyl-carrier protein] reductase
MRGGDLDGRVALVTGGSRGIGRSIALTLAARGAVVAINYRTDHEAAEQALRELRAAGGAGMIVQGDVSEQESVTAVAAAVRDALGPVELLVNNAGYSKLTTHDDLTAREWRKVMAVNLDGPFLMTWAVKDDMLRRQRGSIVNVASVAGLNVNPLQIHYGSAKAGLVFFTKACARAFAPHGVRVNCVAPGFVWTERTDTVDAATVEQLIASIPMGRGAQPEEIASVVAFLLSDEASYVTGQVVAACGGRT